ncbi:5-formaminoimidazole-4-carboxamide-1-(beta)-D-ribofuranosyl 5'-monophosphate synthetase [Candidatus Daviesbacteria bacterium RIFCSPLOWO2_01_FULL_39_12]|uniref:5-formaminoimidazole-4-carboxamide-1-(Beta)-D-ribofuranosyl 5'-monophosphate synthetase n=1 Tax=Candidatus Daviesbacteria bacterium RIFCSPLOWO2_01_FULL_39_12 TaxID=1797785 RepID=A0A1F5KU03_9BACT|nr:MAG: 5-formaminoimidazole-4-carboxamide-1-(beta)-D-ribofuranosyl 5'-monophosphate synthetase [Candidatus Daviesbacteria bacterium RIFCSPHIGHO2_02_FULL_39_8]OGE44392.1 MAG: 5-formaminoimidazole-4-carboxamide-1-(beta)-D-ribofuranosyl 5'-monophosphate synthetase [Candidatus Daviesbacteria bacterium RIFCSPLOWO2_01_FULL_39_12]
MGFRNYTIATFGSHSALQILKGAKDEGFKTLLVCTPDRTTLYRYYDKFIDEIIQIEEWTEFPGLEKQLLKRNCIIIPHGSFVAYLGLDQNKQMKVPYFGNKLVLDWEENRKMQRLWMEEAQVKVPHRFRRGDKIDRPVIVKSYGAAGGKGYFVARNQKELDEKLKTFEEARFIVQEYVIGVPVYFHFFYSPLTEKIEVMSVDKRYETNVDSLGRIPAKNQKGLDIEPSFEVVANIPMAVRESLLADAMSMADRVINVSQKLMPPKGLFGPFCLETIVTSKEEIFVIEISARIVAGTNCFIDGSPYSYLLYDEPMSTGRRIAREIKNAVKQNKLKEVLD